MSIDGTPVTGKLANKSLALLAYLALEPRAHSRERLAAIFWPDLSAESGRHNLRQTLLQLRRLFDRPNVPPGVLVVSRDSLSVNAEHFRMDVDAFVTPSILAKNLSFEQIRNWEHLAELYQGPFLSGVEFKTASEFEAWLCIKRETFHRHALGLLERLSDCYEQNGDREKALHFANRYLELEPWDENGHCRVMRLLALSGQTGAALAQFESCRRLLQQELDSLPHAETIALFERIKAGKLRQEPGPQSPRAAITAERRQVTALYCGFSCPNEPDPDEVAERLALTRQRCSEIIRRFGGHVAQVHGGAMLAYFGYPAAAENSAHNAVRAALALHELNDAMLKIGTGLHSGIVVSDNEHADSIGLTSMLAIRLRDLDDSVTISEATFRLVKGYFNVEPLGAHDLKDIAQPVDLFRVLSESGATHRLAAAGQLTPLTGREREIEALATLWRQAKQGTSRIALIKGEAGIGKSRLILALRERLDNELCTVRELRCFPESSRSPYYPLTVLIESLCGFASCDTTEAKSAKLVQHLKAHYPKADQDAIPLLAQLMSLPNSGSASLSPDKQKEKLNAILLNLLQMAAAKQPVLYIVEDLHWIDPSTLELLTLFADSRNRGPILMLLSARPEFEPAWQQGDSITMALQPLDEQAAAAIVGFWGKDIPIDRIRSIVDRADGVPLFVEELARLAQDGRENIPATLHDLLAAKLDGIGEAKYTAQLAATIGREFDLELLYKVSASPAQLENRLCELQNAGLLLSSGEKNRQFKHALIQEAAYQSQTKADRQAAHRKIAAVLQSGYGTIAELQPELLAQHWSAAGETAKAIHYWLVAGRRASSSFAHQEAISHYDAGHRLLPMLMPGTERDRLEFALLVNWIRSEQRVSGYGRRHTDELLLRAAALLEQGVGNAVDIFHLLWAQWEGNGTRIGHCEGVSLAQRLLNIAKTENDRSLLQQAHFALGNSLFWSGNPAQARWHHEQSIALEIPNTGTPTRDCYGRIMLVGAKSYLSWILWIQGWPDRAAAASYEAQELAQRFQDPLAQAFALTFAATLQRWQGNIDETLRLAEQGRKVSADCKNTVFGIVNAMTLGWASVMRGEPAAIEAIEQSIDAMRTAMSGAIVSMLFPFAEALLHLGEAEKALAIVEEALQQAAEKHDCHFLAELHRLKGECLLGLSLANGTAAEASPTGRRRRARARLAWMQEVEQRRSSCRGAEACFDKALEISRRQGAKSLELRASIALARHFKQLKPLSEVYAWFTEGFDTPDLIEAHNMLDRVCSCPQVGKIYDSN